MPGSFFNCAIVSWEFALGSRTSSPSAIALANAKIELARLEIIPSAISSSGAAIAIRSAVGGRWVSAANGVSIGSPNLATNRPASVAAALKLLGLPSQSCQRHLELVNRDLLRLEIQGAR